MTEMWVRMLLIVLGSLIAGGCLVCLGVWLGGRICLAAQGDNGPLLRRDKDAEIPQHTGEYMDDDDDDDDDNAERDDN